MQKYHGWNNAEEVEAEFLDYGERAAGKRIADFPTDAEIILASYEVPGYEGYAFVLFERDGKLFEVHGSHCSCYGLEGMWEPEETTWEALAMRQFYFYDESLKALVTKLIQDRLTAAAPPTFRLDLSFVEAKYIRNLVGVAGYSDDQDADVPPGTGFALFERMGDFPRS